LKLELHITVVNIQSVYFYLPVGFKMLLISARHRMVVLFSVLQATRSHS